MQFCVIMTAFIPALFQVFRILIKLAQTARLGSSKLWQNPLCFAVITELPNLKFVAVLHSRRAVSGKISERSSRAISSGAGINMLDK
jgi:hypothetical protein